MPRTLPPLVAALALVLAALPGRADASVALGLGGDYLVDPHAGAFELTLAADTPVVRHLTVGARFGAALFTDPGRFGIPLDARIRLRVQRVYLEGLVGPWFVFDDGQVVRLHAGFGFGVASRSAQVGIEVGYLDPSTTIGLRLAFPF